uniref:Secreted protein n=2 Tax=Cannabis sativa TaxID=3483 RepID=A0A803QW04_CANSA
MCLGENVWIEKWLLQCLVTCCCMFNLQAKLTICEGHDGTEFSNGDVTKVRSACDDDDQCKRQQRGPTIVGSEDVPLFLLLPA